MTRTEIVNLSPEKQWKASSIHILLNSLLKKGAIVVEGFVPTGKNYGRTYAAAVTPEEYAAMQMTKSIPAQSEIGESLPKLLSALITSEDVDLAVINKMRQILDKKKEDLEK